MGKIKAAQPVIICGDLRAIGEIITRGLRLV